MDNRKNLKTDQRLDFTGILYLESEPEPELRSCDLFPGDAFALEKNKWKSKNRHNDLLQIVSENLQIKNMVKNRHLAKSIAGVSWHELTRQLAYKAEWNKRN